MSRVWIEQRPPLRSRLSWARLVRTSLARSSASRRWVSERSGAAECFVAVLVDGGIDGAILHPHLGAATLIIANRPISHRPELEVQIPAGSSRMIPQFAGI